MIFENFASVAGDLQFRELMRVFEYVVRMGGEGMTLHFTALA